MKQKTLSFLSTYSNDFFPQAMLLNYTPMECLAKNDHCETYLLRAKTDNSPFIVKCYTKDSYKAAHTESSILQELSHKGLPHFVGEYETENTIFAVREFVAGIPLYEWLAAGKGRTISCWMWQYSSATFSPIFTVRIPR